ncbi:hypothetical protein GGR50DRAFT_621997 [Xylaria sp. CBS 124048]|nr:hypothetical protein GGR50DRAFT_621997 [Xylaria sp. CBS 124048]
MTDRAPGHDQAAEDVPCYNCGMKGHLVFACPEETRCIPAGLEASRKRKASGTDYHTPVKRTKGPVVTHYPPPPRPPGLPPIPPPPAMRSPRSSYRGFHSGPDPAGPFYVQPHPGRYERHPPPYGGQSAYRGFPYGNSRGAYEHRLQASPQAPPLLPPPPPPPQLPPPPPPETPYRPSFPHRYDQHHSRSSTYGRPSASRPDYYNDHSVGVRPISPYAITHPNPHQAAYEQYPGSSNVDSRYRGPPQPYPPQPNGSGNAHGYDGTFPARPYPSNHGSLPPRNYSYPSNQYTPSDLPPYHSRGNDRDRFVDRAYEPRRDRRHYAERFSGENEHNRERRDRRTRYGSPKGRNRSGRRGKDRPARAPSPVNTNSSANQLSHSTIPEKIKSQADFNNAAFVHIKGLDNCAEDFRWEEEMIFKELPIEMTRDLIREPLPAEWTGEPIMPPKYDKETITSKYVTLLNVDEFALTVRETEAWRVMQHHPVFLPPTEIRIEKLREYEKAVVNATTTSSPESGEVCETDDQNPTTPTKSPSPLWGEDHHEAHRNHQDQSTTDSQDHQADHNDTTTNGNTRQSSFRTPSTSPRPRRRLSSSLYRSSSERSSPGDPSGQSSRRSSRSNPSHPSSRRSSTVSPLTPNERELLGMRPYSSDSESGGDSPMPQVNGASPPRPRPRPAKVQAAYQRRW